MTLYEISNAMNDLIDVETGELKDYDSFMALALAKDEKIENTALWIKNMTAEAKAIKEEEEKLSERRKSLENKVDRIKDYLSTFIGTEKYNSPRVSISFRKSTSTNIDDEVALVDWAKVNNNNLLTYKEPTISKTALKEAIVSGQEIPYAHIEDKYNLVIK